MARWRGFTLTVTVVVVAVLAFLGWYKIHYAMQPVAGFEVNAPGLERRLLIATEGSAYKEALVAGLVERLGSRPLYIRVIDVSKLGQIDERQWSAIVVMYHWEQWQPQPDAARFLRGSRVLPRVVALCTSGDGEMKLEGVDTLTSASPLEAVPAHLEQLLARLEPLLR